MPVEDGYLHRPTGDLFPKGCNTKRLGLYGLFVRPEQGEDWLICIFERHVLIFGKPPLDVEIGNLRDERHKKLERYPMEESLFRLMQLQANEYKDTDHHAVYVKNRKRLHDRMKEMGHSGGADIFADHGLYLHHGLHIRR